MNCVWPTSGHIVARLMGMVALCSMLHATASSAAEVMQIRTFPMWTGGLIRSTDPSGITYHPPSGHLFIADSEISEVSAIWACENVFEVSLAGDVAYRTYDAYSPGGTPCPPAVDDNQREPAGITYSPFDGYFYVADDEEQAILRYDSSFGAPVAVAAFPQLDLEDVACDPATGFLYAVTGVQKQVMVLDPNMQPIRHFSVRGIVTDPEGIAFNAALQHLFIVSPPDLRVFEFTLDGVLVTSYDLRHLDPLPIAPKGLTFAPSSDPRDDPDNQSLYIVDAQVDNMPVASLDRDGIVYEVSLFPYDVLAKSVSFSRHAQSSATIFSNDRIEFNDGAPSIHTGNLTALNQITIKPDNIIYGNMTCGGRLEIDAKAPIHGTGTANAKVDAVPMPVVPPFEPGQQQIAVRANGNMALAPGSYAAVKVLPGGTLSLTGGVYNFKRLSLAEDARVAIDSTGATTVNVSENVLFSKGSTVDVSAAGSAGTYRFKLQASAGIQVVLGERAEFSGIIIAPSATITIGTAARFAGSIRAKEVWAGSGAVLLSHAAAAGQAPAANASEPASNPNVYKSVPARFTLAQNVPNPFNPETLITFELAEPTHLVLSVYDIRGRHVRLLSDFPHEAGKHSVRWDGRDDGGNRVSSGVYFYQLQAGLLSQTKRMTLLE